MSKCLICDEVGGPLVRCRVCGLQKKPHGRSAPLEAANSFCDFECTGYNDKPHPGILWPGERYGDSIGHLYWHELYAAR